jgi:cytochrome c oxidase subunit 2
MLSRRTLLGVGTAALLSAAAGTRVRAQAQPRIIAITARKFTYEPAEISLKLNEPVLFRLSSADIVMGFSVPDFQVRATIIPGQIVDVPMTPTKPGEFTFLCDVFCGSGHENMEGTLRVVA